MSFITYRNKSFVMSLINLQLSTIVWQKKKIHITPSHRPPGIVSLCFDEHVHNDYLICPDCHTQRRLPLLHHNQQENRWTCAANMEWIFFFHCNATLWKILTLSWIIKSSPALRSISTTSILASSAARCIGVWDLLRWWKKKKWEAIQIVFLHINFDKHFTGRRGRRGRTSSVTLMSQPAASNKWMTGMWLFFTARWRGVSWRWEQKKLFQQILVQII